MHHYDYIILGGGCAGLSLAMRLVQAPKLANKKILIIDKDEKKQNDRTWCFWEKENGYFKALVFHRWHQLDFFSDSFSSSLDMGHYQYKMIRGIDFYRHCVQQLQGHANVFFKNDAIQSFSNEKIVLQNETIDASQSIVFNSIYKEEKQKGKFYLKQHFKGWLIKTPQPIFNASRATLMDFSVEQKGGTTFVYVLPTDAHTALVEYTLFTEHLLPNEQYDIALKNYIQQHLKIDAYEILHEEFGIIPMTNAHLPFYKNGMYYIGTAGGQTKASTGYTFQFIQKQAAAIVQQLENEAPLQLLQFSPKRFHFYDSTFLHLLKKNKPEGREIFIRLFERNKASQLFKFLDNETTLLEEVNIMKTLQIYRFSVAGFLEWLK